MSSKRALFLFVFVLSALLFLTGAVQDKRTAQVKPEPGTPKDSTMLPPSSKRSDAALNALVRRLRLSRKSGNTVEAARIFDLLFPADPASAASAAAKDLDGLNSLRPAAEPAPKPLVAPDAGLEIPVMNSAADERTPSIERLAGASASPAPVFIAAEQWAAGAPDIIRVRKSSDGGASWAETAVFGGGRPSSRPRLSQIGPDSLGLVYVSHWAAADGDVRFARFSSGLSPEAQAAIETSLADQQGPSLVSDFAAYPAPYLYAAYSERTGTRHSIKVRVSGDLGATWSRPMTVCAFTGPEDLGAATSLAFDPEGGELHVAFVTWQGGSAGIAVARSATFGASWSSPVYLTAPDSLPDAAPAIVASGRTVLVAYEHAVSAMNRDIRYAWSADGGTSWNRDGRLSDGQSDDRFPDVRVSQASGPARIFASYVKDGVRVILRDCDLSKPGTWSVEKDVKRDAKAVDDGGAAVIPDAGPAGRSSPLVAWAEKDPDYDVVIASLELQVMPTNRNVDGAEGTTTFDVDNAGSGRMDWTAEVTGGADWLTIISGASGSNRGTITASFTANAEIVPRVGTIRVTAIDATGSPADVTVTQAGVPRLSVTPDEGFVSSGPQGGPFVPTSATYTVQNTGGAALNWTAAATHAWLDVSPGSGTLDPGASANVVVSLSSAADALTPDTYVDSVTFTNTFNGDGTTARSVSLTVNEPPGTLSVAPAAGFDSSGTEGGPFSPASMTYTLTNVGNTALGWTAAKSQGWLSLSSSVGALLPGGSTTVVVSISATADLLAPDIYNDTVTFTNTTDGRGNTTRPVALTVHPAPGVLSVTPTGGLNSSGIQGGPFSPAGTTYTLRNTGGVAIGWTAAKIQPWLTLSAAGGTLAAGATTTVTVSINSTADSLAPNTYDDTVSFTNTTNGAGDTTRAVVLTVNPAPGALSVAPSGGLTSSGAQGGPFIPAGITYTLRNSGGAAIQWTAVKTQAWVTLSDTFGLLAAGATTTVTVSISGAADSLGPGTYNDTVTFTNATNGGGNTTRPVALTVNTLPGAMVVTPAGGLSSSGFQGGPFSPASLIYTLQNTGGVTIEWTAAKTQAWVTLSAASGTLAAGATTTVTVSISAAADVLTPGTYHDTITFANITNDSGNTTRPVALTVNAAPAVLSVSPAGGLTSSGLQGGPFVPASKTYTLQNAGGGSLTWTASKSQAWLTLSDTEGFLAGGASTTVTVSINAAAAALAPETYTDVVSFTNVTNGNGTASRSVSLTVGATLALNLSVQRLVEKAWIISREFARLNLVVSNPASPPVQSFVVYRKVGDGAFQTLTTIAPSSLQSGTWTFNDTFLEPGVSYTYQVAALDASGAVLIASAAVTI